MKLIQIIPAYNEESTIGKIIDECKLSGDVLVVDDGSTDYTAKIAKDRGAKLVVLEENMGYANALLAGLNSIGTEYDFIFTLDADGEIPPNLIFNYIHKLHPRAFLIGNRAKKNRYVEKIIGLIGFYKTGMRDPLCGGFLISSELNLKILEQSKNYAMDDCIFIYKFLVTKYANNIINVDYIPTKRIGTSRFGSGMKIQLRMLADFLKSLRTISKHQDRKV